MISDMLIQNDIEGNANEDEAVLNPSRRPRYHRRGSCNKSVLDRNAREFRGSLALDSLQPSSPTLTTGQNLTLSSSHASNATPTGLTSPTSDCTSRQRRATQRRYSSTVLELSAVVSFDDRGFDFQTNRDNRLLESLHNEVDFLTLDEDSSSLDRSEATDNLWGARTGMNPPFPASCGVRHDSLFEQGEDAPFAPIDCADGTHHWGEWSTMDRSLSSLPHHSSSASQNQLDERIEKINQIVEVPVSMQNEIDGSKLTNLSLSTQMRKK